MNLKVSLVCEWVENLHQLAIAETQPHNSPQIKTTYINLQSGSLHLFSQQAYVHKLNP